MKINRIIDPYTTCPVYETATFKFRRVQLADAEDLLECYNDPFSVPLFNSDNCRFGFHISTLHDMKDCIQAWINEYEGRGFVRFCVVDQSTGKAAGTIEFFSTDFSGELDHLVGVLRLDLASRYERENELKEIFGMISRHFPECFEFTGILTKAVPQAEQRISALKSCGYQKVGDSTVLPYDHYYIKEFS